MTSRYWSGSTSQLVETRITHIKNSSNGNGGSALGFMTQTGGDSPVEHMRIDKNGNVGIGTTSPEANAKLDVRAGSGGKIVLGSYDANYKAVFESGDQLNFYNGASAATAYINYASPGNVLVSRNLFVEANASGGTSGKVRIKSNGDVGINITNPGQNLTVQGDSSGTKDVVRIIHGNGSHTGNGLNILSANTGKAIYIDGSVGAGFAEITTAYNANPNIRTSGDVVAYASSDKRFKDNLEVIQNPIDKIHKLNGYTFDWNEKQDVYKGKDYGVVAQEVEKVMPEIVDTRFDGYKAVKYEKIVPLLIESIKELKAEIEELKKHSCDCKK